MLTLKELKKMVKPVEEREKIPCVSVLKESGAEIVVRELIGADTAITVYDNGYVLYQEGNRSTVFPLHTCGDYGYESLTGQVQTLEKSFFDNENWYVRLIIEAGDLLERNQEKRKSNHHVCSYSAYSESWKAIADPAGDILESLIQQENLWELMGCLTEKQRTVVRLYYIENRKQKDISQMLGISQQSVHTILKRALGSMRKKLDGRK